MIDFRSLRKNLRRRFYSTGATSELARSDALIIIQITLNEGRTTEIKKKLYNAIADGLHSRLSVRREDVLIGLVEVKKENWPFGNGEAQYAT